MLFPDTRLLSWLNAQGQNLNVPDRRGYTPLLFAVAMNKPDRVRWLVEHGVNPQAPVRGMTPLDLAESFGHTEIVGYLKGREN